MKWTEALFKLEKSGASGVLVTILGSAGFSTAQAR